MWTEEADTLPPLSGQALSLPLSPPGRTLPAYSCLGSYLGNQTGHFVAIELI